LSICLHIGKNPSVIVCALKGKSKKSSTKVEGIRERMQKTLENRKKTTTDFPRSALERKNKALFS
jgi:ElaB/YqjD/DUF883 family membrane-anchored ribosome-binding protein